MSVKRHDLHSSVCAGMMIEREDGDWVSYDDHSAALAAKDAEIATLTHDKQSTLDNLVVMNDAAVDLAREVLELRAEIARLREALVAYRFAYTPDGHTKADCFSTGPRTGSSFLDYVVCPGCVAQNLGDAALSPRAPIDEKRAEGADRG